MLELPEIRTIASQAAQHLIGKKIISAKLLTPDKKFVFSSPKPDEFSNRLQNHMIASISTYGNHLYIATDSNTILNIGDTGGKILFHTDEKSIPAKRDLEVTFDDGTKLTHSVVMWGFISAQTEQEANETKRKLKEEAREPDPECAAVEEFLEYLRSSDEREGLNAKKLIISRKFFTGLGNGYAQDILWRSGIHPKRKISTISEREAMLLFDAFIEVVKEATSLNGRTTERDIFNTPGNYEPAMHRGTLGKPCKKCSTPIEKFSFEGGACYICPRCQQP